MATIAFIGLGKMGSGMAGRLLAAGHPLNHDRNITFTPRLRLKDVGCALQLAGSLGLGTPFGTLAARMFDELCDSGHADENESNVITVARTRSL